MMKASPTIIDRGVTATMRHLTRFFLLATTALVAVAMLPMAAFGQTQASRIDTALALLEEGVAAGQSAIDTTGYGLTFDDVTLAIEALMSDPRFFWVDSFLYSSEGTEVTSIRPHYTLEKSAIDAKSAQLSAALVKALSWIDGSMSDEEKAQAAHDYLVRTCSYDLANGEDQFNAYGALADRKAACQGYADAYKLVLDELGIPCVVVSSPDMDHGWNMVKLGKSWYHVDVTWDDPIVNGSDQGFNATVSHRSFLKSDAAMKKLGYRGWETEHVATTNSMYAADEHSYFAPCRTLTLGKGCTLLGTCEWRVEDSGCLVIRPLHGLSSGRFAPWTSGQAPWASKAAEITSVFIGEGTVSPLAARNLLDGLGSLESADINGLDMSSAVLATGMFGSCKSLQTVRFGQGQQLALDALLAEQNSRKWRDADSGVLYRAGDSLPAAGGLTLSALGAGQAVLPGPAMPAEQKIVAARTGTIGVVSRAQLAKKAVSISWKCKAKTSLSYKKSGGAKGISIDKKTGEVTLKKGLKKGAYHFKVTVRAVSSADYKACKKTFALKVRVR